MSKDNSVDFSLLLASSVHDIKNSLGMLLSSLDETVESLEEENPDQKHRYSILRGEASRINNALIHLLGIYRLQNDQLRLNLDEVFIRDFLEEQVTSQQLLFTVNNINIELDCDDNLVGFFDENLISGIVNNILVNCAKYTSDLIKVSASKQAGYLTISIADNGAGYPQQIIDNIGNEDRSINFDSGSTNLGLYFSSEIAKLHQCKGKTGYIELENPGDGGGCFSLYLP